jgi:hypothetical protein
MGAAFVAFGSLRVVRAGAQETGAPRPNIVFILMDKLGYGYFSDCGGGGGARWRYGC